MFSLTDAARAAAAHLRRPRHRGAALILPSTTAPPRSAASPRPRSPRWRSAAGRRCAEAGDDPLARAEALADALTAEGYAAAASTIASGGQLCQHHCPVAHVAAEFPQLCEAETAVISRLLGTHVQRLATIAHGDGVCTTHIPAPATPIQPDQTDDQTARPITP